VPYTLNQTLRKVRALNKGRNKRIAAALRKIAAMLEGKRPTEFSQLERRILKKLCVAVTTRLERDDATRTVAKLIESDPQIGNMISKVRLK